MNLDELLLLIEKNRSQLSKIDEDFYEKLRERILELEEMKRSAGESDFSDMRMR